MKKIFALLSLTVLFFVACDKIEPGPNGEYTVFAGSSATWTDAQPIANPIQNALVEKYTGPGCVNCPTADAILADAHSRIGDQMILVAINPRSGDGAPFSGQPDMSTDDGEQWVAYYGIANLPHAMLNRDQQFMGSGTMNEVEAAVNTVISQQPAVAVELSAATVSDGKVSIDVTVQYLQQIDDSLTLTLVLIEDSLVYLQAGAATPMYNHDHMLRDVITDVWGIGIQATGTAGEARKASFSYSLPDGVVKANSHIVALVSNADSRHVLNSASCKIDE